MARMMPAYCPQDAPPGEKKVFTALQDHPGAHDWQVLHSLAISKHSSQVEGEADFVIIVPKAGVLVIEVKSHGSVSITEDGLWKLGHEEPTPRNPFEQAKTAMYSILEHLQQQHPGLTSVPFHYTVWFTAIRRNKIPKSIEWQAQHIMDVEDLDRDPVAAVLPTLRAGNQYLDAKNPSLVRRLDDFNENSTRRVTERLRPFFEAYESPADVRRRRTSELKEFTQEQFEALDSMSDNRAVLFQGAAGTGKTFLAIESVKRELHKGASGRLLCYNRLLADHLRREFTDYDNVRVNTLHKEMLNITGWRGKPNKKGKKLRDYWNIRVPTRAVDLLMEGGHGWTMDFLVIDEFQDLARPLFLDVLDLMVEGGLKQGRIVLFADFGGQSIYGADNIHSAENRFGALARHQLMKNCRNRPRIGYAVNTFAALEPGYQGFRREDDGIEPTFIEYSRGVDCSQLLSKQIRELQNAHYKLHDIVVLSPRRDSTGAETTDPWLRNILVEETGADPLPDRVRYTTIHSFKGLDAPAVILTDLDSSRKQFEALFYIGMTRATDRLVVLIERETYRALPQRSV